MENKFTQTICIFLTIVATGLFWGRYIEEASKYETIRVTTCGHVTSKVLDGESSSDGEGHHFYTDHRVIVYEDKSGKRYTYEFKDEEREEFYKIKVGEAFCASHAETRLKH